MRTLAWTLAALILFSLGLSVKRSVNPPLTDWRQGELVVAISPNSLHGEERFEIELAKLFAQHLNRSFKAISVPDERVEVALLAHEVHFSATGMRKKVSQSISFSQPYQIVNEQLICRDKTPARLDTAAKRELTVAAGSTQAEALTSIAANIPHLKWTLSQGQNAARLLQQVALGKLDCTVANEQQIALARTFYPQLGAALDIKSPSALAWGFAADSDAALQQAAATFLHQLAQDGRLHQMLDRHFGHNERLEAIDLSTFKQNIENVLPKYVAYFRQAAAASGFDWKLLAGLAYQESHWNPLATSFTNVRGIMMLTESTANQLGVKNRLDSRESILAGANYLKLLKNSLPNRINEQERTWMALAAYNQGMGHLEDARVLAAKSGLNPDVWLDVRQVMPWLSQSEYYEASKHGQVRGGEAVILVETVRLYQQILQQHEATLQQPRWKNWQWLI